jgi:hypothetical protein
VGARAIREKLMNSATKSKPHTVELPANVAHYRTDCFAENWHAYDMLTVEDGWTVGYPYEGGREFKEAVIRGHRIVVHPPLRPQGTEEVVRDILAESMTPLVSPGERS